MKKLLWLLVAFFLLSCGASKDADSVRPAASFSIVPPPGTSQISENLFIDNGEVTNRMYLQFLSWNAKKYGRGSDEYKRTLPDTTVWKKPGNGYAKFSTSYLRNPKYQSYPVVGISFEQARAFAKWRSDRVMQLYLVRNGLILNRLRDKTDFFTIEKYFKGQYHHIKPDTSLRYPHYRLPSPDEFKQALAYADSHNARSVVTCQNPSCIKESLSKTNCGGYSAGGSGNDGHLTPPTKPIIMSECGECKTAIIEQLKGNLREMTNSKGRFFGRSYWDSCKTDRGIIRNDTREVNTYTGFRNVCVFKKWPS